MYVTQEGERYGACVSHSIGTKQKNVKLKRAVEVLGEAFFQPFSRSPNVVVSYR